MRRLTALLPLIAAVLVMTAAPALAQRDPFEPAVVARPAATDVVAPQGDRIQPRLEPPPASERLADTGIDPRSWLGLAYLLTTAGLGVTLVGRLRPVL